MSMVTGWLAIALALFALAPSIVPGAFSVFGLLISLVALIVSVFSVKKKGKKYFTITMAINIKLTLYGLFFFVVMGCAFLVARLATVKKTTLTKKDRLLAP